MGTELDFLVDESEAVASDSANNLGEGRFVRDRFGCQRLELGAFEIDLKLLARQRGKQDATHRSAVSGPSHGRAGLSA